MPCRLGEEAQQFVGAQRAGASDEGTGEAHRMVMTNDETISVHK